MTLITEHAKAILSGKYTAGDEYWEKHNNIVQAVNRLIELDRVNYDNEMDIASFTIGLEIE